MKNRLLRFVNGYRAYHFLGVPRLRALRWAFEDARDGF